MAKQTQNTAIMRERVAKLLEERDIAPTRLSLDAGLNKDTVSGLLAGKRSHPRTIERIAQTLNVSVDYLTGIVSKATPADTVKEWDAATEPSPHIRAAMRAILDKSSDMIGCTVTGTGHAGGVMPGDRLVVDTSQHSEDGALMLVSIPGEGRCIRYRVRPYWIGQGQTAPTHTLDAAETRPIGKVVALFRTP